MSTPDKAEKAMEQSMQRSMFSWCSNHTAEDVASANADCPVCVRQLADSNAVESLLILRENQSLRKQLAEAKPAIDFCASLSNEEMKNNVPNQAFLREINKVLRAELAKNKAAREWMEIRNFVHEFRSDEMLTIEQERELESRLRAFLGKWVETKGEGE